MAAKRESVARARVRDFTESEQRAHSCRQDGVDAAIGEHGKVELGVKLCHDTVGDGLRGLARCDSVARAFAVRPLKLL